MELEHIINACKIARHYLLSDSPEIIEQLTGVNPEDQKALRHEIHAEFKRQYPEEG